MTELIGHVENPSAKIQFVQITQTAPGCCAICGSGQDKNGFIDTGLDFEFWGRVFFCSNCALELAAVFGFISPDDYADLEAELNCAKFELNSTKENSSSLEKALAGLLDIRTRLNFSDFESIPNVEIPTVVVTDEPNSDGSTSDSGGETEPESSRSDGENSGQPGETPKSPGKPRYLNI